MLKPLYFVGSALEDLRAFPRAPRREAGYQLNCVQDGDLRRSGKYSYGEDDEIQRQRIRGSRL